MRRTKLRLGIFSLFMVFALILANCGVATTTETKQVNVLGVWGGDELASFQAAVAPWEAETGYAMGFSGTRDLNAVLTSRLEAGNPPDIAILPNPGLMHALASEGRLIPLDSVLDADMMAAEYSQGWVDLGTVDGQLYAIFFKAANKGTIWYSPKVFAENGWSVPTTWEEMIALSDQMKAAGLAPWSVGVESGGASGWPGTDWIGEILLHESGPEAYDQWVAHEIAWTDQAVKSAFEKFGQIALTEGYVPGGAQAVLATNFIDGSHLPFQTPPQAGMYYLGSFTQGFISEQFPDQVAGEDYSFFPFPTINPAYAGAVTGGADVIVMLRDTPAARSLMQHLAGAQSQQIWVERGGFTAVNSQVSLDAYPDVLAAQAAAQLTTASIYRFDADDSMPAEVQAAFWKGVLDYLQNPDNLDAILAQIEAVANEAYTAG